ncbi:MAG: threonine--tRNA ligase, partial [Sulfitobacter sp.]|nr:threonine--tRNA ligase [Sulfitobacter sp.]
MADQDIAPAQDAGASEGPFPLSTLRHSVAHLMASAVQNLHPGVRFGFGPSIEHGFYYDFDSPEPLTEKDLSRIEKEMRRLAKKSPEIRREVKTREEATSLLQGQDQSYKVEAVGLIPEGEELTFYFHGPEGKEWGDLCEGPHIDSFKIPFAFKLLSLAGAYWRGDEKNPMMQRIYGTAFWTKEE